MNFREIVDKYMKIMKIAIVSDKLIAVCFAGPLFMLFRDNLTAELLPPLLQERGLGGEVDYKDSGEGAGG
jgi:hypothetical protein